MYFILYEVAVEAESGTLIYLQISHYQRHRCVAIIRKYRSRFLRSPMLRSSAICPAATWNIIFRGAKWAAAADKTDDEKKNKMERPFLMKEERKKRIQTRANKK